MREFVPGADDLDPDAQYILDGTLLPCWSWAGHKELYSGKHKATGMNVQVACTIYGKLAWIYKAGHGRPRYTTAIVTHRYGSLSPVTHGKDTSQTLTVKQQL